MKKVPYLNLVLNENIKAKILGILRTEENSFQVLNKKVWKIIWAVPDLTNRSNVKIRDIEA